MDSDLIQISPTAMGHVPVLVLLVASLAYLCSQKAKPIQTRLFCGWLGGMTLMTATQCAAHVVYTPLGGALDWLGAIGSVSLALVAWLQFAYTFPRPRYRREARTVLLISLLATAGLFTLVARELITEPPRYLNTSLFPVTASAPIAALNTAARSAWIVYDFESFSFGFASTHGQQFWTSYKLLILWQILAYTWTLLVWLRKTVQFSEPREPASAGPAGLLLRFLAVLGRPQGREARLSRVWVLLVLLAAFPLLTLLLQPSGILPQGSFATVNLTVFATLIVVYVNYTPHPTTFMVKLVGISLSTLLAILGLSNGQVLTLQQEAYHRARWVELAHVEALVRLGQVDAGVDDGSVPADVQYIAARPATGLFSSAYDLLFSRVAGLSAPALAAEDASLYSELVQDYSHAHSLVARTHPWLGVAGLMAVQDTPWQLAQLPLPERFLSYRGVSSRPEFHFIRYCFIQDRTLYEVGYSYPSYRQALHIQTLPLLVLTCSAALTILFVFPLFFRIGLVNPLHRLMQGVNRVDRGDLQVEVPVEIDDEIGVLTHAFNRMVGSLYESEARVRALNLTLEQRVADRTRELATLYQVAALTTSTPLLDELLPSTLRSVLQATGAAAGAVLLQSQPSEPLYLAAQRELSPSALAEIASSPAWRVVQERSDPLVVHDLLLDPQTARLFSPTWPYPTLVGIPIQGKQGTAGVLGIFGTSALLFNVEDVSLFVAVAEQISIAIENARLREQAEDAAVLEERQRLSRDLHDSVTQLLYSQTLLADAGKKYLQAGQAERAVHYLERVGEAATQALREMRLLIYRLRPGVLASEGLAGALQRRLELVEQRAGVQGQLQIEALPKLPAPVEQVLFFVAEEALNNTLKHGQATAVVVRLRKDREQVELAVEDDGRGFDVHTTPAGLGLAGMRERTAACGGTLNIASGPGAGTRVVARLPLSAGTPEVTT